MAPTESCCVPKDKVVVAVARKLSGFVWDTARQVKPPA
jgi:hypothetical protein